jgi:hypothetical protein
VRTACRHRCEELLDNYDGAGAGSQIGRRNCVPAWHPSDQNLQPCLEHPIEPRTTDYGPRTAETQFTLSTNARHACDGVRSWVSITPQRHVAPSSPLADQTSSASTLRRETGMSMCTTDLRS